MWYYMVLRSDLEQNVCYRGYGTMSGLWIKTLFPDAPNGVHRVNSEEEGWELWTKYLYAGGVHIVQRPQTNLQS